MMFFSSIQIGQTENAGNLTFTYSFDLIKCHRESNVPQLIFVVSWLQCAFVARSRWITKCAKKKEQVLAAHIFTEAAYLWSHGMRYVAGVYLRVDARLNFHNLIENFAAIQT